MNIVAHARAAADNLAQLLMQALILTAVTVLFVLSGYAARQGLQALAMLGLSTALLSTRVKGDAQWLAAGAAAVIGAGALHIAFVLPAGHPLAFPETLVAGAGSWCVVGIVMLARGRAGESLLRRRPEAWRWIIGAATWLGIALTYADADVVAAAGAFGNYLWLPWASVGVLAGSVALPWGMTRKLPPLLPAVRSWASGIGKSFALVLLVGVAVASIVAQLTPVFAQGAVVAAACRSCDPAEQVVALRVTLTDEGLLVAALFGAPPTQARLHLEALDAPIGLQQGADGRWEASGHGTHLDPGALAATVHENTLLILVMDPALLSAAAVEGAEGSRAPKEGWASPTR